MFAIYNIDGCRFRDTLENLRKVQKTQANSGTQLQANVTGDETPANVTGGAGMAESTFVSNTAQQAYKDMLKLNQREQIFHAHQLMSQPVSTVQMETDILTARSLFQQLGFQQIPVLDARQRLVGMLSLENLLQFIIIDGDQIRYLRGKRVFDVMSPEVITADPVSDIRRVAQVMREHRLQSLPIVDKQDTLIGIVSRSDILRAITNEPPLNMWS